jgi:peptidoglycan/LPS O-acetylase OafA/YrhL
MFAAMAPLVIRLAYTVPWLAQRLLSGNDISYGVYIYHMPLINLTMWFGLSGNWLGGAIALASCVILAMFSWFLVERPALASKRTLARLILPTAAAARIRSEPT